MIMCFTLFLISLTNFNIFGDFPDVEYTIKLSFSLANACACLENIFS